MVENTEYYKSLSIILQSSFPLIYPSNQWREELTFLEAIASKLL